MRIAEWETEAEAQDIVGHYDGLIGYISPETVCSIYKHTTLDKWWVFIDDIDNTNTANGSQSAVSSDIDENSDITIINKTHQELVDDGYLPDGTM